MTYLSNIHFFQFAKFSSQRPESPNRAGVLKGVVVPPVGVVAVQIDTAHLETRAGQEEEL